MRAEPWGLVRTDHGSSTIHCIPSLEVIPTPNFVFIFLFKYCYILYFTVFSDCFAQHFGPSKLNLKVLYK